MRSNFADTALWIAALETNSDGIARAKLTMPKNLTTWKIKTWAMGAGTNVGESSVDVVTTKKLLLRLQAPRFFTEYDEVVLSANVHNYLKTAKQVRVVLEVGGKTLEPLSEASQTVEIPADGEKRVDWKVKVVGEGEAVVRMKALTDEESDAMEMKFPVYVHGMLKTESFSGALRPEQSEGKLTFDVPEARRVEESRLEVRYSPTLAGAMVDALPYLTSYPYGCTEQTLSRFLPTVITQRVLIDMGLNLKDIQNKRTNLNAQQIGDDALRAKQWQAFDHNPVFDEAEVSRMVKSGVQRLTDMQCSDGGWGWFSGYGEHSYPHTTAYVVHGFQIAQRNDVALVPGTLDRGIAWLKNYQDEEVRALKNFGKKNDRPKKSQADNLDAFVFMVLVDADHRDAEMLKFLERDRPKLSAYALSMYGLALHKLGEADKLAGVLQNLSQYVVEDAENQTAYLNLGDGNYWWYWYGSDNEAMAYYLKLLSAVEPKSRVASGMVKYLLNNRKNGTYWKSTRDTALCIEALAEYLKASGESRPNLTVELWLDGKKRKETAINADNLFSFDNSFVLEGEELSAGRHTLEVRKSGEGPLYYNAYQTNFTKEQFITKAGLEVKVERKYYKLVRVDAESLSAGARGQAVSQKVEKYDRQELANLAEVKSGDLIEIELEIESKNDYEYLMFEDMKAAGCEPVDVRSGYNGNGLGAYMELRDEKVCLFTRTLPRGRHSVSYRVRAEIPGTFSALPTRIEAMYAPELRGNSDEMKISIAD
ncbi:MAG: alpha-2-macroglobulin family protein [Pirellulales bacterium]